MIAFKMTREKPLEQLLGESEKNDGERERLNERKQIKLNRLLMFLVLHTRRPPRLTHAHTCTLTWIAVLNFVVDELQGFLQIPSNPPPPFQNILKIQSTMMTQTTELACSQHWRRQRVTVTQSLDFILPEFFLFCFVLCVYKRSIVDDRRCWVGRLFVSVV